MYKQQTKVLLVFAVNFNFLLQLDEWHSHHSGSASSDGQQALDMTLHTLRMMAHGGMHDHVGQVGIDTLQLIR